MEQVGAYWDLEQCRWVRYVAPDHVIEVPEQRPTDELTGVAARAEGDVRSG